MENYREKIGCLVHIPNVGRGRLKYVGPVEGKPGMYAGVDLLANIGKNDGSFEDKKYFDTEHPCGGLFIQLKKLESLIEMNQTQESRRNTLVIAPSSLNSQWKVESPVSSIGSTGNTIIRAPTMTGHLSPTPVGEGQLSYHDHKRNLSSNLGIDSNNKTPRVAKPSTDLDADISMTIHSIGSKETSHADIPVSRLLKDQENRIIQQEKEIILYKKLLNDQRIVLEDLQPTIDEYEKTMRNMEIEIMKLRNQMTKEREQQKRQKLFFETEHEQLLAVVEELHQEIKTNEMFFKHKPTSSEEN